MAGRAAHAAPPLITNARVGTSLSTDQRTKRYLLSMGFRVACFIGAIAAPLPWNVVLFVSAAIVPGVAVLLGNAKDNRPAPIVLPHDEVPHLALTAGEIVRGEIADEEDA